MTTDHLTARNEIFARHEAAWTSAWTAVFGATPLGELRFAGLETSALPSEFWARASVQTVIQELANVGQIDNSGARRYRSEGLTFLQVFAPKSHPSPLARAIELAYNARLMFLEHRTPGGVWFRNVRVDDGLPTDERWIQTQMVAEWQSDQIVSAA